MPTKVTKLVGSLSPGMVSAHQLCILSVSSAVLLWSTSFVATKLALGDIPPLTLAALRFWLAAGLMIAIVAAMGQLVRPTAVDALWFAVGGLLGITGYFSLENLGVHFATAADAALLVAAYPAITLLREAIVYRSAVSWPRLASAGVAMIGVALIVYSSFEESGGDRRVLGDVLLVASGVVWALYNFVTRRSLRTCPALTVTYYQTVAGAVAFLPHVWIERDRWQVPAAGSLLAVVYLGVFCSVLAFLLYARGLRGLDAGTAVGLMNLVPVFGLVLALLVLREPVQLVQVVGGLVVITGVAMSVRQASRVGGNAPFQRRQIQPCR